VKVMEEMLKKIMAGDRRSVARAITMVENRDPARYKMLAGLRSAGVNTRIIGITGPPGAGKSSLVDRLISEFRSQGFNIGIIAVDPSSPFTGGAILGDRVRMQQHCTDPGVFIRSMGARGNLGGLAPATREAAEILAASGKDLVFVETVGVGQSELEIMKLADTTVLVLTPAAGDSIQTIKAGIMEIADIFVVNKADLTGSKRLAREIRAMLHTTTREAAWYSPVIETETISGIGTAELADAINNHFQHLQSGGKLEERRNQRNQEEVVEIIADLLREWLNGEASEDILLNEIYFSLNKGEVDPYRAAEDILKLYIKKMGGVKIEKS